MTARSATPIPALLDLGGIFYRHFGEIAAIAAAANEEQEKEAEGKGKARRGRGAKSRVSPMSALFAICAVVVDNPNFVGQPIEHTIIWQEVLDSLFRGERYHCYGCLAAMSKMSPKWAEYRPVATKIDGKDEVTGRMRCTFSPVFLEKIRAYVGDVSAYLTDNNTAIQDDDWISAAQIVFDYFRFRYTPEWYLFVRRIIRSEGGTSVAVKEKLSEHFYTDSTSWSSIHTYLNWLLSNSSAKEKVDYLSFLQILIRFSGNLEDGTRNLRKLSDERGGIRLYSLNAKEMTLEPNNKLRPVIDDYILEVEKIFTDFRSALLRLGEPASILALRKKRSAPARAAGTRSA